MEKYDVFISVKPKARPKQKSVLLKSLEQNAHCIYETREEILKCTSSASSPEVPPAPPPYVQTPPTFHSSYPKMQMDPVTGDLDTSSCSSSNPTASVTSGSENGSVTAQPSPDSEDLYASSTSPELRESSLDKPASLSSPATSLASCNWLTLPSPAIQASRGGIVRI